MTGIVKGYEITTNRDSSQNVLMLQVEVSGPGDVQTIEYMSHAGDDHIPPIDSVVTILTAGKSWKIAIASNDKIDFDNTLDEGEKKIYSSDSGTIKAIIKLLKDGKIDLDADGTITIDSSDKIELNGNSKSFVTHAELNTALQSMISALNIEMQAIAAGATAAVSASGLWLTPLAGVIGNNSIDISSSETTTIKTGG